MKTKITTVAKNEDSGAVACKMTKELRLALRGSKASVNGFDGPINYAKTGVV